MTLATHIITGAAAAKIFSSHPVEAFLVGWVTHYILDSIPHWDYKLKAYQSDRETGLNTKLSFNKAIVGDLAKVCGDALIGFVFVLILFFGVSSESASVPLSLFLLLTGAIGGAFPDLLQFLYAIFKKSQLLQWLQKFHHFIHARKTLDDAPVPGIACQVLLILIAGGFFFVSF